MPSRIRWVALNYSLPTEPSKNRVYVWRKLKEMGAVSVNHGIALLPKVSRKVPELVLLCERIKELGGEAAIIEMNFVNNRDEQAMVDKFERQSEQEYTELIKNCEVLLSRMKTRPVRRDDAMSEEIKRLVRQYGKARGRNHFGTKAETELERAIDRIFDRCVADASDFTEQLQKLLGKAKF